MQCFGFKFTVYGYACRWTVTEGSLSWDNIYYFYSNECDDMSGVLQEISVIDSI